MSKNPLTINIHGVPTFYDWKTDTKYLGSASITPTTRDDKSVKFFKVSPVSSGGTTASPSSSGSISGGSSTSSTLAISSSSTSSSSPLTLSTITTAPSTSTITTATTTSTTLATVVAAPSILVPSSSGISDINGIIYQEEYVFGKSQVSHFGINSNRLGTVTSGTYELDILGETVYLVIPGRGGSGFSAHSVTNPRNLKDDKVIHHPLEKALLQKAITHLINDKNSQTVLVDIFARVKGAVKFYDKEKKIEVHTIVLYKLPSTSGQHEILIIDPNSSEFSRHFSNDDIHESLKYIAGFQSLTIPKEKFQIYKPVSDKVGFGSGQYRDCIDIAVKLAFGFNDKAKGGLNEKGIDHNRISEHTVIQAISNLDTVDKNFFVSGCAFRIKQNSNIEKVKLVNKLEKIMDEGMKMLAAYDMRLKEYFKFELVDRNPQKLDLPYLIGVEKNIVSYIKEIITEQEALLGDLEQDPAI